MPKERSWRRWTVMIVPDGTASPRTLVVCERKLRRAAIAAGGVLLVCLLGAGSVGVWAGSGSGRRALAAAASLDEQRARDLEQLGQRVSALRDTLEEMANRDERIRVLAGLQPNDSLSATLAHEGALSVDSAGGSVVPQADVDQLIAAANTLSESFAEVSDTLAKQTARLSSMPSIMPTAGWLSSHFTRSRYHPILHVGRPHEGIDVAAPMGAPVVAPAAAVVARVTRENGYGLIVELDHGNGIVTKYAHLSSTSVRTGQRVTRGQTIAAVGNSGLSTGPHLHYEIHINGRVVDPLTYVLPSGVVTD